ncbi:hypothetical protein [Gimesia aquarii]|nr:hypothetical protein [Gimesia aquarii]
MSGFTVSGTRQSKDRHRRSRSVFEVSRSWRLTFGGDRVGYLMEVIDYEKPKYQNPKSRPKRPKKLSNSDEVLRIPLRTKQWGYWGHDLSGNHYEDTVITVTPSGKVTDTGKMHNSSLFAPRGEGPLAPRRAVLWSLGRFFSKHIDKVTQVEHSADGLIRVSALGKKNELQVGRWEFEIEPNASWMIRKARFYRDRYPDRINVEMKNEGTVWSGAYCIPKTATINHWGPIGNVETEYFTFEPVVESFDEQLYSDTQQAVVGNQISTLTVHDYRVSPPIVTQPFRPSKQTPITLKKSNRMWWLIIVNLVVFGAMLVYYILWKRQQTNIKDP